MELNTVEELLQLMVDTNGSIISSAKLTYDEIQIARVENRMYVDDNGYGYVVIPDMIKK